MSFENRFERPRREPDTVFENLPIIGPLARTVLGFSDHDYVESAQKRFDTTRSREQEIVTELTNRIQEMSPEVQAQIDQAKRRHPARPFE